MNETAITIIGLLLLTGAMAKSAQIPLHSWLPGSMEGLNGVKYHIIIFYILRILMLKCRAFLKLHYMLEHPKALSTHPS
jgi:formate hydrogenlyase subunit 3/multisubunit Na+/H+ antiporter MnhD subunit